MPVVNVGDLTFHFDVNAKVGQYDQWTFYRSQFQNKCGEGNKAVDLVCLHGGTTWLIEVKDYRHSRPAKKPSQLPQEVAFKVRDTLAGLTAARFNANDRHEKELADECLRSNRIQVVLHLEQPQKHSKLFPRPFDEADIRDKLRRLLKAVDPHPMVLSHAVMQSKQPHLPWHVK